MIVKLYEDGYGFSGENVTTNDMARLAETIGPVAQCHLVDSYEPCEDCCYYVDGTCNRSGGCYLVPRGVEDHGRFA